MRGLALSAGYTLDRLAQRSAGARIFRARDRATGRAIAIKLLDRVGVANVRRFDRECRILAGLEHPGIVEYLGHGVAEDGSRWLAMEWLDGEDLRARLDRGSLTPRESLVLVRRLAETLAAMHAAGIVHRDLKPANLFLVDGAVDKVKLLDFGIARILGAASGATMPGLPIGTPSYMAPEQARGESEADPRCDMFSLGCVLFECLAGVPPFVADTVVAVLAKILFEEVPRLRERKVELEGGFDDLLARMLSKQPEQRPVSMMALLAELDALTRELDEDRRRTRRRTAPGITALEQRLFSVVVCSPGAPRPAVDETPTDTSSPHAPVPRGFEHVSGRLEVLTDGTIVALVSGPAGAGDQAAAAAREALSMRRAMPEARVALATARGSTSGPLPVGAVIDRAVELLAPAAPPLGVRIDETTAALLREAFALTRDVHGFVALDDAPSSTDTRTLLGRATPCVGRDAELSLLETLLQASIDEPRAQAVVITGAAGVGKTRLRYELLRRLPQLARDAEVLMARGDPVGAGSAFAMLAAALRPRLDVRAGDAIASRRSRLRSRVAEVVAPESVDRVAEFMGELVGVHFEHEGRVQLHAARQDPRLMGDQIARAFEEFLVGLCAQRPVVLVLDDLHWGDLPSVKLVDASLRALADRRLFVLALARPEVGRRFPELWSSRRVQELKLHPLGRRAADALVRAALGASCNDELITRVVERGEGNAFFLEELSRAIAEGRSALPDSVLSMVEARLDTLGVDERRVLRAASVFRGAFTVDGAVALLGDNTTRTRVDAIVTTMIELELLDPRGHARAGDSAQLVFRHALLRDTVYATLTEADRRLGHRLAGAWLESVGEPDPLTVADHFERGDEPTRATAWFRVAAEQALAGNDFANAVSCAERGLAAAPARALAAELTVLSAEALAWSGDLGASVRAATAAIALAEPGSAAWFRAHRVCASTFGRLGDHAAIIAMHRVLADSVAHDGAGAAQAICLCALARALFQAGRYDLGESAMLHAERGGDVGPAAAAERLRLRGARARHIGDVAEDLRGYTASLAEFERAGDTREACNARVSVGFAHAECGDYELAWSQLERARDDAERMGLRTVASRARQNLGLVLTNLGRHDEATALLQSVVDESLAQANVRFAAWTRIYLALALLGAGDASSALQQALDAAEALSPTPPAMAGALAAATRAALATGRIDHARTLADRAVAVLDALQGIEEFEALVRLAHVEALLAAGARARARAAAELAVARVLRQADALESRQRARFVTAVPENARLISLAASLVGDGE